MGGRPDLQEKVPHAKGQKPDGAVAGSTKKFASRFNQIKTGHCLTGQYLNWTKNRPPRSYDGTGTRIRVASTSSSCIRNGRRSKRSCGQRYGKRPGPPGGRQMWTCGTGLPLLYGCWKAGASRGE